MILLQVRLTISSSMEVLLIAVWGEVIGKTRAANSRPPLLPVDQWASFWIWSSGTGTGTGSLEEERLAAKVQANTVPEDQPGDTQDTESALPILADIVG